MRRLAATALLLLAACGKPPVSDEVTITLDDDRRSVTITSETTFELRPPTAAIRTRIDAAREAAVAGTDAWSTRFARTTAETERVTFERNRGELERVVRTGRFAQDDLQRFFADASLTIDVLDGDGWRELIIYPAASTRANREQRERFGEALTAWSRDVARYYTAVDHLYTYLDQNPGRARYVFDALFSNRGPDGLPVAVNEEEEPLLEGLSVAMDRIGTRLEAEEGRAYSFAEEADLLFNPFPAKLTIKVPGSVTESRGFVRKGDAMVVEPIDLFATIAALEGKWISPDPLAILLRSGEDPDVAEIAAMERQSSANVTASEIETALREALERPKTYSVRWVE